MEENEIKNHLYVLILCGGGGTRLWPRSRQKTPKQFLTNLYGQKTLYEQTVERALCLTTSEKVFVVTNNDYLDEVVTLGRVISPRNIIAEPQAKNTTMAMGVGAAYIYKKDPQAIIVNLASDGAINNYDLFTTEMLTAVNAAASGEYIVTVGITPSFPHTGLGYIQADERIHKIEQEVYKVRSFKEKPDLETAKDFILKGNYYWNANLYVWAAQTIWNAFQKLAPDIFQHIKKIYESLGSSNEEDILRESYDQVENISIDYAISEKASNLVLVPATFSWSDVGDWKVVYDLKEKDTQGNILKSFTEKGECFSLDCNNCLVESQSKLIATIGLKDIIVVETENAILICQNDRAQDVKKVVEDLKSKGKTEYL
jgi:mannose-1-phosphate guanylyltransferase